MQKSQLKVIGAVAAVAVIAGGGFGIWSVMKDDSDGNVLLSASDGAAARAERDLRLPDAAEGGEGAALDSMVAADSLPIDCGIGGEPYVPTEEELASANGDTDALAAVLAKYGIAHEVITDPSGFKYIENDYQDLVAMSVISSFWDVRYPTLPPTQAEFDDLVAQNDVIAAALDEAGIAYTRSTDSSGWDTLDWDYENPDAQAAVDSAYAELYPPEPPSAEQIASMKAENDKVAAAFDKAGVDYWVSSDELGWEWVEWDYDDAEMNKRVDAAFAELYEYEAGEDCSQTMGDGAAPEGAVDDDEPRSVDEGATEAESVAPAEDFTAEEIAQRDAEATALMTGFQAAGVEVRMEGESPWQIVLFDVNNDAAVDVVASVLASRS